jgi:hypothetical protein
MGLKKTIFYYEDALINYIFENYPQTLNQPHMIKNLFLITILATSMVACKSKAAFKYSQDIVAKERSLAPEISATDDKVGKFAGDGQFDSVAAVGERMEKLVQKKIDEINGMKVPSAKEAENFKQATLKYFKYIKSIYTGYREVGNAKTEEERQRLAQDLQEVAGNKADEIGNMQKAQKKYAAANGFKVED